MTTLRQLLTRTYENLSILQQREAKHAGDAPLELLNQITDHKQAVERIKEALNTELSERQFAALKEDLRPLLIATNLETLDLDELRPAIPVQPYEPETIEVPAGSFLMGSQAAEDGSDEEIPQHPIELPVYRIGKYPVTNEQYADFVKQTGQAISPKAGWELARIGKRPPQEKLKYPVVGISWDDAVAFCQWLTGQTDRPYRLPTEAEWEKAARGGHDSRVYPWGDTWEEQRCNHNGEHTTSVDQFEAQSPYECCDMVGNVWEWTGTMWGTERAEPEFSYPYQKEDGREDQTPRHPYREYRICRGGSYRDKPARLRCSARARFAADKPHARCGFRVVLEL